MPEVSTKPAKILRLTRDGYRLYIKDDGRDYASLWAAFRRGEVPVLKAFKNDGVREVYLVENGGQKYILKIDRFVSEHPEIRLWYFIFGPFHSRNMRRIRRALDSGCTRTADIYFVAEKMGSRLCREAYIIQEYFEGPQLYSIGGIEAHKDEVRAGMMEIHAHNLAFNDCNPTNMILTKQGLRFIDMDFDSIPCIGMASDILRMKKKHGIVVPPKNFAVRLSMLYYKTKRKFRSAMRDIRKKIAGK